MVETQQYPLENRPPLRLGRTVCPVGEKGLAAQVAGRPAAIARFVSGTLPVRLRLALESLGPVFVKFGQVLSTRPDLIPHDYAVELAKLQDKVPPFDADLSRRQIERPLASRLRNCMPSLKCSR